MIYVLDSYLVIYILLIPFQAPFVIRHIRLYGPMWLVETFFTIRKNLPTFPRFFTKDADFVNGRVK